MNKPGAGTKLIPDLFFDSVSLYPDNPALGMVNGKTLTYHEAGQLVTQISKVLSQEGIVPGDKVALYAENSPHWGISYLAILEAGAIAVPILPDFHVSAVQHILRHSESKALFTSNRLLSKLDVNPVSLVINTENFNISRGGSQWETILRQGEAVIARLKEKARRLLKMEDQKDESPLAVIIYTSGTTGHSKGVMLSHKSIISNIQATQALVGIRPEDRFLSILPLAHTFECTLGFLTPLASGSYVNYLDKPPTAPVLLPALKQVSPTILLSVPLVIEKIYKQKILPAFHANFLIRGAYGLPFLRPILHKKAGRKLMETFGGKIRMLCIGGAPLAHDAELFLKEAKIPYSIGYGLTETSPLVTGTPPELTRLGSAGKPILGVSIRIDHPNPQTGAGEIWIQGANVMSGYYRDPEKTAEVLTEDGWFHSGDLGYLDADGYLFIKGRSKNMILGPSGENIYPEEIESILNEHEWVSESLVIENGKELVARVFLNYEIVDQEAGIGSLNETEARKKMAAFLDDLMKNTNHKTSKFAKIGRIIEQPEPFEKTPTQKIKRYLYTSKPLNGMSQS